jgi:hypothetical protein
MNAYIEIVGKFVLWRHDLYDSELREIGEFTRENVSPWLDRSRNFGGVHGWVDFHAVCGDVDIPWATQKARLDWENAQTKVKAYVEIMSKHIVPGRFELQRFELCAIGEFTRENISRWLDRGGPLAWSFEMGIYGWTDFHAVCGDIDIPWATEEARLVWGNVMRGR